MKIVSIELKNFKFHKELKFDINKKNCLIYGENGTGKSSIYWALYSVFKKDLVDNFEVFKNYNIDGDIDINIEIKMDNNNIFNLQNDNEVIRNNKNSIYFANQDLLEEIIANNNLYYVFDNLLKNYFQKIESFINRLNLLNNDIDADNYEDIIRQRLEITNEFDNLLFLLTLRVNDIINNHFEEKFTISFNVNIMNALSLFKESGVIPQDSTLWQVITHPVKYFDVVDLHKLRIKLKGFVEAEGIHLDIDQTQNLISNE